ncbi:M23 family metallopeptidase [Algoriphagus confluentis]|uniref:M23ase beta-sheet core domain-containing protein n=1 Tax=Algoriphagus confluentis TaxID=1697556 RepID=A0ABQ6PJN6_9BACT|nr:hypothetical protein Aconfl_04830 [Algoriphagus confluentis]
MKFLPTLVLFFTSNLLFSQVQIVAEQDQERNLTLMSFNKEAIPYTIEIRFNKLENLESPEGELLFKVAKPGKSILVKLLSIYGNVNTSFNYNTKLYKGDFQNKVLSLGPYLLPVEEGTVVDMRPLSVNNQSSKTTPYTGVGIYFHSETKVCAPKKGIISEVQMNQEEGEAGLDDFSKENYIEIYHQDGTFTRLSGLQKSSASVEVGEIVIPGQVIGISSVQTSSQKHHVKMIQSRWEIQTQGVMWINFPVNIFAGGEEVSTESIASQLTSSHPEELIIKELDKKELKKYSGK